MVGSAFFMATGVTDVFGYFSDNQIVSYYLMGESFFGPLLGISGLTVLYYIPITMSTVLLLVVSALACFALFYKAIEWFEHI
ncbi:hypothetical protein GCM10028819_27130 [Spirosoma humi]